MAQIRVMVLLNNLTYLLARPNEPPIFEADQVRWFQSQLEYMLAFLVNSEATISGHGDDGRRKLVILKKLADEIGDLAHEADQGPVNTRMVAPPVPDRIHIQEIINSICINFGDAYKLIETNNNIRFNEQPLIQAPSMRGLPRRMCSITAEDDDDDEAVGLNEDCKRLVGRLISRDYWFSPSSLNTVAIIGEGGTGKSTLADKVYNHVSVTRHFTSRAWIPVSNKYRLKNLLLGILNHVMVITQEICDMEEWELRQLVLKQLRDQRYLIVMDDVWNAEAWYELNDAIPHNKLGSRVVATTRSREVAYKISGSGYSDYYELRPLSSTASWELFCKVIFGGKEFPCSLGILGQQIVGRCRGRPIVIVVVASILRATGEMTLRKWSLLRNRLDWYRLRNYKDPVLSILSLWYQEIPQHLKACFLYLSVFPEDFEIPVEQLIQLWIAEGLITWVEINVRPAGSMEDLARGYVRELVSLNLVQVTKRRSNGDPKSIRIHDIIRDLCINLSWDEKFVEVYGHSGRSALLPRPDGEIVESPSDHSTESKSKPWVLSILSDCGEYIVSSTTCSNNSSHVRSFSCFSHDARNVAEENWEWLCQRFPLLRVLNLEEVQVGKLPLAIEWLSHLRYLRLNPERNTRVPKSIFNLWNLQVIDLGKASLPRLPKGFWKLKHLRHLYLDGQSILPRAESEDCLPNLLTLSYISNTCMHDIDISEKAPNLRKLGLYGYVCDSEREQDSFNFPNLRTLKFAQECTFEESITLPATITKVTVKESLLQPNVIQMFEKLPNLEILKLVQTNFENDELVFGEGSFPQLQLLKFETSNIVRWELKKGAMPKLQRLVFRSCSQLPELPDELWEGDILQELEMFWPSTKLAKKLAEDLKARQGLKMVIYPPPANARSA